MATVTVRLLAAELAVTGRESPDRRPSDGEERRQEDR